MQYVAGFAVALVVYFFGWKMGQRATYRTLQKLIKAGKKDVVDAIEFATENVGRVDASEIDAGRVIKGNWIR